MIAFCLWLQQQSTELHNYDGFASLGVGGVLAGMMFWFYRQDRKASEERVAKLADDFRTIVEDNTRAITKLSSVLEGGGK